MQNASTSTVDREIRISRLLNAPVELVWEVWTDPKHLKNWWGPNGFTNTVSTMDVKPGGEFNLVMHGPDGTDYPNRAMFTVVEPFKKIVYDHRSTPHFVATIEFEKRGDKTHLSWHIVFDSKEQFIQVVKTFNADEGLKQSIEKLSTYVEKLVQS